MNIRLYNSKDKDSCLAIFDSNCPKFFDMAEREMFVKWLDHQGDAAIQYKSSTYTNSEADVYFVIELPNKNIIASAGFYILKDVKEARLAWGMIHANNHQQGLGSLLFKHRKEKIKEQWPEHKLTLGTSQHTFSFYKKMGMRVINTFKDGYGIGLDRYDMEE